MSSGTSREASKSCINFLPETFLDRIAFYMIISYGTYHCLVLINRVMHAYRHTDDQTHVTYMCD